jgi:predicted permease
MSGILIAQVAVSVVLIAAAVLFVRSFRALATRDTGFERERALLVTVDVKRAAVAPEQRAAFFTRVEDAVRGLPGVSGVATSMTTPSSSVGQFVARASVAGGRPLPDDGHGGLAFANVVSPRWFATVGTRLVAGRDFDAGDRQGAPMVVIVNETLARATLGRESPLGRTLTMTLPSRQFSMTIVGVVADSVYYSLREATTRPVMYTPVSQFYLSPALLSSLTVIVRAANGPPALLSRSVGRAIEALDPAVALTFSPLATVLDQSLAQERLVALLSGFFGALALLLAGVGLYGVTAYAVTQRRTELGIRMALGAGASGVMRLVLARVLTQVAAGVLIGAVLSGSAARFVAAFVYGVTARDLATVAPAAFALAAVTVIAGGVPAWRASRLDPAAVLRSQ